MNIEKHINCSFPSKCFTSSPASYVFVFFTYFLWCWTMKGSAISKTNGINDDTCSNGRVLYSIFHEYRNRLKIEVNGKSIHWKCAIFFWPIHLTLIVYQWWRTNRNSCFYFLIRSSLPNPVTNANTLSSLFHMVLHLSQNRSQIKKNSMFPRGDFYSRYFQWFFSRIIRNCSGWKMLQFIRKWIALGVDWN